MLVEVKNPHQDGDVGNDPSSKPSPNNIRLSWEPQVSDLIRARYEDHRRSGSTEPLMVCVVGIPGSGKSSSCTVLPDMLSDIGCFAMPFDGYHIPLSGLKTMPNADDKIYRRGAPDTFDASGLARDLDRIKYGSEPRIEIPGFDHAIGDPSNAAHTFKREEHNIVICEGLYLLHEEDGWRDVAAQFNVSVFIEADLDVCMSRLKVRNRCIPGYTPEEIDVRVDRVDRQNALKVMESKRKASLVVKSAAFPAKQ